LEYDAQNFHLYSSKCESESESERESGWIMMGEREDGKEMCSV
jgi:hypothetical protein